MKDSITLQTHCVIGEGDKSAVSGLDYFRKRTWMKRYCYR